MDDTKGLSLLGNQNTQYTLSGPSSDMLEAFPNQYPNRNYKVTHTTNEFTSLCPKTGQPDFAEVTITFIPHMMCVETKSLKLYLFAYRNEGSFMETITNRILEDIVKVIAPRWIQVECRFNSRGGISTSAIATYGKDY